MKLCSSKKHKTIYMERILEFVIINSIDTNSTPALTQKSFPFIIFDIPIPQCGSGFVYFSLSIKTRDYTCIGECKCIIWRLYQHNSCHGSSYTAPSHRIPYAILGYICGFNGQEKPLR